MIHGIETVMDRMKMSSIDFYLTGSRFFGTQTPRSDYDFFTENSSSTVEFLRELGFYEIERYHVSTSSSRINLGADYHDINIARVFRHDDGIDVQLVKSVKKKMAAQRLMKLMIPRWHGTTLKTQMYSWWNLCYRIVEDNAHE